MNLVTPAAKIAELLRRIEHVRIPIVAGIWPLVSYRNAEFLHNEVPGVRVTASIMERMRAVQDISRGGMSIPGLDGPGLKQRSARGPADPNAARELLKKKRKAERDAKKKNRRR